MVLPAGGGFCAGLQAGAEPDREPQTPNPAPGCGKKWGLGHHNVYNRIFAAIRPLKYFGLHGDAAAFW